METTMINKVTALTGASDVWTDKVSQALCVEFENAGGFYSDVFFSFEMDDLDLLIGARLKDIHCSDPDDEPAARAAAEKVFALLVSHAEVA